MHIKLSSLGMHLVLGNTWRCLALFATALSAACASDEQPLTTDVGSNEQELSIDSDAAGTGAVAAAPLSAAEIAANNTAVWASLPPNVTMTVIEKLPQPQDHVDHYTQNETQPTALAVATLPFDYTFDGVWSLNGRDFRSTQTRICQDIEVTWDYPQGSYHKFQVSLSEGGTITVPTDGVARSYCWSGVPTNTTLYFHYGSTENCCGDFARGSGSGRVRYP